MDRARAVGRLRRQPAPRRRSRTRGRKRSSTDRANAAGRTASSRSPPSQYASTTRSSSGSAMPFDRAISSRYGHAPSKPRASSRIRRRSPPAVASPSSSSAASGSAVAEPVGAVGVPREADRTRCRSDGSGRARCRRSSTCIRRPTTGRTASPARATGWRARHDADGQGDHRLADRAGGAGTSPLTTAAKTAVTGAPRTSTLATTEAGARRRAASQVADVGGEEDARAEAPCPLRRGQRGDDGEPTADQREIADEHDQTDPETRGADDRRRDVTDQESSGDDDLDGPQQGGAEDHRLALAPDHARSGGGEETGRQAGRRARRSGTSPDARRGTARRGRRPTRTIVLWMNAAVGALAIASPLKNRMKGTLPPITPMTAIVDQERRSTARTSARRDDRRRDEEQDRGRDAVLERRVDRGVRAAA